MAVVHTQVEYRKQGDAHWFFGRDRLSNGLLVGNKDFKIALTEMKRQLKESLEMADVKGTPKNTSTDEELEKFLTNVGHHMTVWSVDSFS